MSRAKWKSKVGIAISQSRLNCKLYRAFNNFQHYFCILFVHAVEDVGRSVDYLNSVGVRIFGIRVYFSDKPFCIVVCHAISRADYKLAVYSVSRRWQKFVLKNVTANSAHHYNYGVHRVVAPHCTFQNKSSRGMYIYNFH